MRSGSRQEPAGTYFPPLKHDVAASALTANRNMAPGFRLPASHVQRQ